MGFLEHFIDFKGVIYDCLDKFVLADDYPSCVAIGMQADPQHPDCVEAAGPR